MTIRDYIKRRARWNWALLVIILLTANIAAALVSTLIIKLDMKTTGTTISLSTIAIILWRQMHIKCPRCHMDVGLGAAMEQSNRCQNCEVSFDEPAILPEGVAANSAPKPLTIRKYVQNRVSQVQIYLIFAIALVGIGIATQYHARTEIVLVGGIVIAIVSILVGRTVAASARGPNCSTQLARTGASLMTKKPADSCPACGVKFDEPMPKRAE